MALNKSELPPKGKSQTWRALWLGLWVAAGLGAAEPRTIVFFGDSLSAGYGLDPDQAFPALVQRKVEQAGLAWKVVNAGLSGETSAGGLRRVDWILRQPIDIFVLELGGNDGLRGLDPATTRENLNRIAARIRARYPNVMLIVAGMQMPTNLGPDYTREFASIFPDVARTSRALLIPFLLEGVGGVPALNQADGIHPNAEGHRIVAETVWRTLQPLL